MGLQTNMCQQQPASDDKITTMGSHTTQILIYLILTFYSNEIFEFAPHCRIHTRKSFARHKHLFHKTNTGQKTLSYIDFSSLQNNLHGIRLSHIFEIPSISNEKPSISIKILYFDQKPWISIEILGTSNQKFRNTWFFTP